MTKPRLTTLKPQMSILTTRLTTVLKSPSAEGRASRHLRGYGTAWDRLRLRILKRDNGLCQVCLKAGQLTQAQHVDHITPKAEGGTDDEGNLQSICEPCHNEKTKAENVARMNGGRG